MLMTRPSIVTSTRIDLAYAIYAASYGATEAQIEAAIRSRDLSHKGGERRQADYVERTIRKAFDNARNLLSLNDTIVHW